MKKLLGLALLSGSLALAASTPATLADQLALSARAVRGNCPVQVSAGAECSTASMSVDIVRQLIDIDQRKLLTKPWRQLVGESVQTFVEQDGQLLGIALFDLAPFKTLIVVSPVAELPKPATSTSAGVAYFEVRMLVWVNGAGQVTHQGKVAPASGQLIPLSSLTAVGCTVQPQAGNMVRVSCDYPTMGTLSETVKLR